MLEVDDDPTYGEPVADEEYDAAALECRRSTSRRTPTA